LSERWEVSVYNFGSGIHVSPVKNCVSVGCWALTTNPRRDTSFWGFVTGRYLRMEYPKTEKQLRAAVALCQEWCDRQNAHETEVAQLVAAVADG
jgi:hypothetical protein